VIKDAEKDMRAEEGDEKRRRSKRRRRSI
jgi:hypothetical protein